MANLWWAAVGAVAGEDEDLAGGIEFWSTPERSGWLSKQGEFIKTWRRRWFVLKQGKLFWFKDSDVTRASKPRGVIAVRTCSDLKEAEDAVFKPFAFRICTRGEIMYFIADSKEERERWMNSIARSIVQQSGCVIDSEVMDYDSGRSR